MCKAWHHCIFFGFSKFDTPTNWYAQITLSESEKSQDFKDYYCFKMHVYVFSIRAYMHINILRSIAVFVNCSLPLILKTCSIFPL